MRIVVVILMMSFSLLYSGLRSQSSIDKLTYDNLPIEKKRELLPEQYKQHPFMKIVSKRTEFTIKNAQNNAERATVDSISSIEYQNLDEHTREDVGTLENFKQMQWKSFEQFSIIYSEPPPPASTLPTTTDCSSNGGFENGVLLTSDWNGRYSYTLSNCNKDQNDGIAYNLDPTLNKLDPDCFSTDWHYKIVSNGNDPVIGPALKTVRTGNFALKLGNSCGFNNSEAISKRFTVTNTNANFSFWYATVLETGDHEFCGDPVFGVRIYVGNSNIPLENFVNLTGSGLGYIQHIQNSPFYTKNGDRMYSDWRCCSIDLSQFLGNTITIEFYTKDCLQNIHWGYAYIDDISCASIGNCVREGGVFNFEQISCTKYCFNYFMPQVWTPTGPVYGNVQFFLRYNDKNKQNIMTYSSPIFSHNNINSHFYCFNSSPPIGTDYAYVEAVYSLNGYTWSRYTNRTNMNFASCFCCIEDTIYSSSKYGYNRSLPVIVSNNAKYHEIEFCSFEENNFVLPAASAGAEIQYDGILPNNISFVSYPNSTGVCVTDVAHTGKKSLQVFAGNNPSYPVRIAPLDYTDPGLTKDANHNIVIPPRYIEPQFNVLQSKKYKMRLWIKSTSTTSSVTNYVTIQMKKLDGTVLVSNAAGSFVTDPIEGWKLYELDLPTVGTDAREMTIQFHGGADDEVRFFDDIRIIPSDALAKSYVYHEKSLKLISELDENHFATFYDYDEAGNLIRVRKETERGIITLKEATVNYQKKR